jgi:hypothetical protein
MGCFHARDGAATPRALCNVWHGPTDMCTVGAAGFSKRGWRSWKSMRTCGIPTWRMRTWTKQERDEACWGRPLRRAQAEALACAALRRRAGPGQHCAVQMASVGVPAAERPQRGSVCMRRDSAGGWCGCALAAA